MNNPYISRGPVRTADWFFGRTHELEEISAFLKGNQSVSVVGPRKIGKTSLLFHLMRPATRSQLELGSDYLLVYLDCEVLGEGNHDEIFGQLLEEISEAMIEQQLAPEPAIEEALVHPNRLAFERAVRRLNQRGLRLVVLLDEFERLSTNPHLDVNFFNALRSAAGRYQLAYITASAKPLIQLTYSGKSQEILSSPFFNIFAPLFLGPLSADDARQLIRKPSQAAGVTFSPVAEDFILQLAGGFPLALQVACFHAFDHPTDHVEIERRTTQELAGHFEYYWHNLSAAEQSALRQISSLASRASSDTTLRALLRDLVQKCLLVQEEGAYRYSSRAWANFVNAQERPAAAAVSTQGLGLLTGTRLGSYEVLELLGRGGMSEVYKGRHTRLERTVAIKILSASLASESDFRTRFEREAQAVAALRHPNLVQMFDFGDVEGTYYMVMEFIAGKDLGMLMNNVGPMPIEQVLPLAGDIASALDYAHAQGLVHRDVKPSNVLLQPKDIGGKGVGGKKADAVLPPQPADFRAILTDFGIAKITGGDTGATRTGLMIGTLNYMAPEQIRSSGNVDHHADIYALGVVLFQMVTGRLPFLTDNPGAMMLAHLQTPPDNPCDFVPGLPPAAAEAILRALEKDPADRFNSATELVKAMAIGGYGLSKELS